MGKIIDIISIESENQLTRLTQKESAYLRLTIKGDTTQNICHSLKVSYIELFSLRRNIISKLKCKTWRQAVLKALKLNILKKEDYLHPMILKKAHEFALKIVGRYCLNEFSHTSGQKIFSQLEAFVKEFYKECRDYSYTSNDVALRGTEEHHLKINAICIHEMPGAASKLKRMRKNHFARLKIDDWFNGFKKVFQFRLISKEKYQALNVELEAIESVQKISEMITSNRISNNDLLLEMIHTELIHFYNKLGYNYLLDNSMS